MEKKINILELLKDCPSGMELDCTIYDDVTLYKIDDSPELEYPIQIETKNGYFLNLTKYGTYTDIDEAKCVIFPKGKTTWEGFQRPFEDGDVVVAEDVESFQLFLLKHLTHSEDDNNYDGYCYFGWDFQCNELFEKGNWGFNRHATEEEKEKLFDAIKEHGYKWNDETKTLEKLIEPWTIQDAKDGDVLAFNDETIVIFKDLYNKTSFHSYCHIEEGIFTISKKDMPDWWEGSGFYPATEEQRDFLFQKIKEAGYKWNPETKTLEKVFELKFKVGDRVQNKNTNMIGTINLIINDEREYQVTLKNGGITYILFEFQDSWELINEPKFKVDDKIKLKGGDEFGIITQVTDCFYTIKCKNNTHCWPIKKQDDWELVPDIKPKFKVGDRIRWKVDPKFVFTITSITKDKYECGKTFVLRFTNQDEYELVPNKFDITTLKPFESKVLVRNSDYHDWCPAIFGCKLSTHTLYKYATMTENYYAQCIPYEGNEHLLGTTKDCDDFYKTW